MDHHPLRRVENKRVRKFNALHWPAELRTKVGRASIRGINMEPESLFLTCKKISISLLTSTYVCKEKKSLTLQYDLEVKLKDTQTGPSSDSLSKAHAPVVPRVEHSWKWQNGSDEIQHATRVCCVLLKLKITVSSWYKMIYKCPD